MRNTLNRKHEKIVILCELRKKIQMCTIIKIKTLESENNSLLLLLFFNFGSKLLKKLRVDDAFRILTWK